MIPNQVKNVLFILVGAPGSGKSTWGKKFVNERNIEYISSDELRAKFGKSEEDQSVTPQVFSYIHNKVEELLGSGKSVMVDATNINKKDRAGYLQSATRHGAYKIAIVFEVSREELIKRNKERGERGGRIVPDFVIDKMLNKYQRPTKEEFDKVVMK